MAKARKVNTMKQEHVILIVAVIVAYSLGAMYPMIFNKVKSFVPGV